MSTSLTIDQALDKTNPFGRYQFFMAAMLTLWILPVFCNHAFFGFAGLEPSWSCNQTLETQDCGALSQCPEENLTFHSEFYSVPQEWSLVCDKSYIVKLIASLLYVGRMVGELSFGWVVDSYGRKRCIVLTLAMVAVSGICTAFAPNWKLLAVGEVLTGFSIGCLSDVIYVYSVEFTTNPYRLIMVTTGGSSLPRLAAQALIGYVSRDWRRYLLYTNVLPLLAIALTILFAAESPRWLLQKGFDFRAKETLDRIAKFNGHELPENYKLYTIKSKKSEMHVWDLFTHGKLLAIFTLLCMVAYFETGIYIVVLMMQLNELTSSINLYLSVLLVGILSSFSFVAAIFELRCPKLLNRRRLLLILSGGIVFSGATIFILTLFSVRTPIFLSVMASVCYTLVLVKVDFNYTLPVELFPTLMRANMNSLAGACGSLGAILGPQLLYFGELWPALPYLVFCILASITFILTFVFYPNTNRMDLMQLEQITAAKQQILGSEKEQIFGDNV